MNGGNLQMAAAAAARVDEQLLKMNHHLEHLSNVLCGRYYYELEASVELKAEENSGVLRMPMIPSGYVFIAERIAVQAPKGSRLQLYSNAISNSNFLEVIANVQEYSEGIVGSWQMFGPGVIVCNFTKAEAAGIATVVISGMLIPREPAPGSHIP